MVDKDEELVILDAIVGDMNKRIVKVDTGYRVTGDETKGGGKIE